MGIVQKDGIKITLVSYVGALIGLLNKMLLFPLFLDTDQVGLANLMVSLAVLFSSIALLGTPTVMLRYLPRIKADPRRIGTLMWRISGVALGGFLLVSIGLIIFRNPLQAYYSKHSALLVENYLYLIPFGLVTTVFYFFDNYLRSLFKTVVPVFLFEVVLRLAVTAVTLMYVVAKLSFEQFMVLYLAAHTLPTILILVYTAWLRRLHIRPGPTGLPAEERREMIAYGTYSFANFGSQVFLATLDGILVAGSLGLDKTGVYTTMFFFVSMLMIPYRAIAKIAGPVVSENWARNDMAAMDKLYKQVTGSNIVVGAALFTLMWVNLDVAFAVMPPEYATGRWALFFLAMGRLFDMFSGINGLILVNSPRYKVDVIFSLALIAFLPLLIPVFIRLYDMEGAAIGTSIAIILYNAGRLVFIYRTYRIHPVEWRPILFLLLAAVPVTLHEYIQPGWGLLGLTIARTVVVVAYFVILLIALRPSAEIDRLLSRILARFRRQRPA